MSRCDCVLFVVFYKIIGSVATTGCSLDALLQVILLPWVTVSIFTVLLDNQIFIGVLLCPLGHKNKEAPRKYGGEYARERHGVADNLLDVCGGSRESTTRAASVGAGAVRLPDYIVFRGDLDQR